MNNFILFLNSFLSYLLLMAVIVILVSIAVFIGIRMRRKKDLKETATSQTEDSKSAEN